LALVLADCLDRDVACRGVGRSGNQSNLHCGHARMSRATSRIGAKTDTQCNRPVALCFRKQTCEI
jgi:hypothetical protein